jgi:hypothetical protein
MDFVLPHLQWGMTKTHEDHCAMTIAINEKRMDTSVNHGFYYAKPILFQPGPDKYDMESPVYDSDDERWPHLMGMAFEPRPINLPCWEKPGYHVQHWVCGGGRILPKTVTTIKIALVEMAVTKNRSFWQMRLPNSEDLALL